MEGVKLWSRLRAAPLRIWSTSWRARYPVVTWMRGGLQLFAPALSTQSVGCITIVSSRTSMSLAIPLLLPLGWLGRLSLSVAVDYSPPRGTALIGKLLGMLLQGGWSLRWRLVLVSLSPSSPFSRLLSFKYFPGPCRCILSYFVIICHFVPIYISFLFLLFFFSFYPVSITLPYLCDL